ncbi:MAG TPA: DNA repair protein RecN [Marmoricola sp.]|nr:DNA repair protein RecN [Nocardioidaceae bacterium]MCB8992576.1 DNA repair protein RecN [Nocardioidaceae bacterium]MCO5323667.1 DNA repair protein RecN [Nocardioidaceae bacterium]HRV68361.1 DNA repair protein RecN [Marmoricola sp.]
MIQEIRINDLGVIEETLLPLDSGLTVITGETGAGKTMLITALGLLLGGRADAAAVRAGAKLARIEGIFSCDSKLAQSVEEHGGLVEDDTLLVSRQVAAQGRSRAFIGGAAVPVSVLSTLADSLVAVHGQSDQHRLVEPGAALRALDSSGDDRHLALRAEFAADQAKLKAVEQELRAQLTDARAQARELEMLQHGIAEISDLAPQPGEDTNLATEEARLGAADTLRVAAQTARQALSCDDETTDANAALSLARQQLQAAAEIDPTAVDLAKRADELGYLLADLASDIAGYVDGIEVDPQRLAFVSGRRAALGALTRKYGADVTEVLAWEVEARARVENMEGADERIQGLKDERARLRRRLAELAVDLSGRRQVLAARLGEAVTAEINQLSMPHAQLSFVVTQRPGESTDSTCLELPEGSVHFTESGVDQVEIHFSAHPGSVARPLHKGASGGELSRVMLGLEVVLASTNPVPTMVFDEVDAGVGGKAAVEIGRRLGALSKSTQVLVVTHLPQVAAFADSHFVVRKSSDGSVTTSGLERLDKQSRVKELSRMLAGLEESDTALAHAEELLDIAQMTRNKG